MNAFRIFFNDESSNVKLLLLKLCDRVTLKAPGEYVSVAHKHLGVGVDQFRLQSKQACCSGDELKISEMHIFLEIPRPMWSA